ncbi:MAG: apolipoprotein N-acyltransferase [Halioglobus sp.]
MIANANTRSSRLLIAVAALAAGSGVTLSLAPIHFWPAGIISCIALLFLLQSCTARQAFWRGWLFGLGVFGTGVSWVYVSIHVHGNTNIPLAVFLTCLFCGGLALLHGMLGWCYAQFVRGLPGGVLIGMPILWVLFEWFRSWFLTGFPWLYLGYAHVDTWLAGWAPIVGIYGLSLFCVITASCIYLAWRNRNPRQWLTSALVSLALWLVGAQLQSVEWVSRQSDKPISVAIYQPNIPQEHKWDRAWYQPILQKYQSATESLYGQDIVIWPESAIPNFYQRSRVFIDPIARRAADNDTTLITGIPFRSEEGDAYFNSIVALGAGKGVYHKQRLVPFGEYLPLEKQLRGLISFFDLPMSSFSPGLPDQAFLRSGDYSVAPYICYEVVYPDLVARNASAADILITISNDSWFGSSLGPLQHLQMAQMRALENGRYLIRATNNGVSAIIDHRGDLVVQTPQFVETTLKSDVFVMSGKTPFGYYGSTPLLLTIALVLSLMAMIKRRGKPADS